MDEQNIKNFSDSYKGKLKFAGLGIIKDDLKYFVSNKSKLIAIIVIAFIPLLYSFLYLDAFWDPYSKLDKMPVAVVNHDNGSIRDGKNVNYGNEFVDKLKDNKTVKWVFTDYSDAEKGVNGKKYYSMVVIPENFSRTITDSVNGSIGKASISYIPNEKKNFLAAQVSSRIMLELKDEVAKNITSEGSKILVDSLYKTKDGFKTAYDGSKELNDGASKLYEGSVQLDDKLGELKNGFERLLGGSQSLLNGLSAYGKESGAGKAKLVSGAKDLSKGTGDMYRGLKEFNTKITDGENKLISGIKEYDAKITAGESSLKDASGKLSNGLNQLTAGLNEYNTKIADGENQLFDGSNKLLLGLEQFNSGFDDYDYKVTDGERRLLLGAQELSEGTGKLYGGLNELNTSLSLDGISTFSQSLSKASKSICDCNPTDEKYNALLQDLGKTDMTAEEKGIIIKALATIKALSATDKGMPALESGAANIQGGFAKVIVGVSNLTEGAKKANAGASDLKAGVKDLQIGGTSGRTKLNDGITDLTTGATQLLRGIRDFKEKGADGYKTLYSGAQSIKTGADQLSAGINEFQSQGSKGRQSLLSGMSTFAGQSAAARKSLLGGAEKLSSGSNAIYTGLKEFDSKTSDGINKLINGTAGLNSGENEAFNGVERLRDEGSSKIKSGLSSLCSGTQTLQKGLNDGYTQISSKLDTDSDKISKFLSEPVSLVEKPIDHVPEYGSGFTPYFIPLSLWVGALLMFLFVPMGVNKKYKNSHKSVVFGKFALLLAIGILQAVITSIVILTILHLHVQNVALFFGFNILLSAAFISIIQSLVYVFGEDVGKFLSLVLLMLQLTSCGGTFPMELVPKFFSVISPYLPMTYGTAGLREIISGIDYSVLRYDSLILTAFVVGFLVLSVIMKSRIDKIKGKIIDFRGAREKTA